MSSESTPSASNGSTAALAIIREYLGRSDARVRRHALTALAALENPTALDQLAHQTRQDHDPAVRRHGIDERHRRRLRAGAGQGRRKRGDQRPSGRG